MLVGNMNRRELGHKCVAIPRILALYILVDHLLFSLAHDNTSVYNMTSEAPRENEYCQFSPGTRNHLLACLFTFRSCIYDWMQPAGRVRHNIFYTDGSKSNDAVSVRSACFCNNLNQFVTHSLNSLASIFMAECIAVISAVNLALKQTDRDALIFTDSLSVLLSLKNPNFFNKNKSLYT